MRKASVSVVELLVGMMAEFYAEADYALNAARAREAFGTLLSDPALGEIWLAQAEGGRDAGYMVLTFGYSMEYGGRDAFIDDLFIRPAYRNAGLGSALVRHARDVCVARGVRALHLEAGRDNDAAQRVYRKAGFTSTERQLLTLQLAEPTHAS
jgi:ribosomal protein S18 acetylase RimI-like enzyme